MCVTFGILAMKVLCKKLPQVLAELFLMNKY